MSNSKPGTQELTAPSHQKRLDTLEEQLIDINIDIVKPAQTANKQSMNKDSTQLFGSGGIKELEDDSFHSKALTFRSKDEQRHFEKLVMSNWGRNKRLSYMEYAMKRPIRVKRIQV